MGCVRHPCRTNHTGLLMRYSIPKQLCFPPVAGHTLRADFEGGALSSLGDRPLSRHCKGAGTPDTMMCVLNQATQHWHTGNTRKRAISVRPGHRVYESPVAD